MSRSKRRELGRAPSHEEFLATLSAELGFLVAEFGFSRTDSPADAWRARFHRDRCRITLLGSGYGQSADLEIEIDGQSVSWPEICPSGATRFTPVTDTPQLDDLREAAYRLRRHLAPLLRGEYELAESARRIQQERESARQARRAADPRGTFFSRADALWKNERWPDFIEHLGHSPHRLTPTWERRLAHARARLT